MSSIEQHIKDAFALTNSLNIKLTDLAVAINKGLLYKYGLISPDNPREWKYYLNLAGVKHRTNNNVEITLLESGKRTSLTKEILGEYQYTTKELTSGGSYYQNLINKYPDDIGYIKGCISPVDIDVAIQAKEGTILSYNTNLVEPSEYNLIKELEDYIKMFLSRWHIREYNITDDLYLPALLATLYANLPAKIINLRIDKIYTNEAHSFHLENFFNSRGEIWEYMEIFNDKTKYWLYKNFRYLTKHMGKNQTLESIAKNVLGKNGVGIGVYELQRADPTPLSKYVKNSPSFTNNLPLYTIKPLNDIYQNDNTDPITTEDIVTTELKSVFNFKEKPIENKQEVATSVREVDKLHLGQYNQQTTKMLDIRINKFFEMSSTDTFQFIIDHWAFMLKSVELDTTAIFRDPNIDLQDSTDISGNRNIGNITEYVDPSTNKTYNLTSKQGFYMMLKMMLAITGNTKHKIRGYRYRSVLDPDPNKIKKAYTHMYKDGFTNILLDELMDRYPAIHGKIFSKESFQNYLQKILDFHNYVWVLDANSSSFTTSGTLKYVFSLLLQDDEWLFVPEDEVINGVEIDTLLAREGIEYELPDTYNFLNSLNELVKVFTGFNIASYFTKSNILTKVKEFLNKVTSYTTQTLADSEDVRSIQLFYNNIYPMKTKYPIIGGVKGDLHGLEHNRSRISSIGINVIENPVIVHEVNDYRQSAFLTDKVVRGYGLIAKDIIEENVGEVPDAPMVEIKDGYTFDLTKSDNVTRGNS